MNCETLQTMMSGFSKCERTEAGTKFETHCVYPSFEVVSVYVSRWGDGFKVNDGGGAVRCAFAHGRDEGSMKEAFKEAVRQYDLTNDGRLLGVEVNSLDWLYSAIIAVANGSALAATKALENQVQKKAIISNANSSPMISQSCG